MIKRKKELSFDVTVMGREIEQRAFSRSKAPSVERMRGPAVIPPRKPHNYGTIGDLYPQSAWDYLKQAVS